MTQFQTTVTDLTTNDDGLRASPPRLLMIHTFEGQDLPVERMMDYQSGRLPHQRTGSYHVVFGADGRSGRENDNPFIPWAAGWNANRVALHGSLAGRAAFTREQWLARPAQLDELARWLAHESRETGIPLVKVTGIGNPNVTGVCGHVDASAAWPRDTDHTDPGPGFPWAHVLDRARLFTTTSSGSSTTREDRTMDDYRSRQLDDIHGQLAGSPTPGEFPGWPQLGDRTPVDALAVIGAHLGLPGFYDPRA